MESSLSPRDIQTRIRRGETPQSVADSAGVPVEQIARFRRPGARRARVHVRAGPQDLDPPQARRRRRRAARHPGHREHRRRRWRARVRRAGTRGGARTAAGPSRSPPRAQPTRPASCSTSRAATSCRPTSSPTTWSATSPCPTRPTWPSRTPYVRRRVRRGTVEPVAPGRGSSTRSSKPAPESRKARRSASRRSRRPAIARRSSSWRSVSRGGRRARAAEVEHEVDDFEDSLEHDVAVPDTMGPRKKRHERRRVPSWDEIMFGDKSD